MGLIDRAKTLRAAAVDRLLPQRVVFHHVPKCGGTSVGRALRRRYLLSQATVVPQSSFQALEAFTGRTDRQALLVDVLDLREQMLLYHLFEDVRCVSAHVRFSSVAHRRFANRYKFITILREPVARFVSHFRWSYGRQDAHGRIEEPFAAFLETDRAKRLGATYVEYYCGLPKDADLRSAEAIEAAVHNLGKFAVVGRLDRLADFERDVERTIGVHLRIGHENKAPSKFAGTRGPENPEFRDRILELCEPDIEVWRRFLENAPAPVRIEAASWTPARTYRCGRRCDSLC